MKTNDFGQGKDVSKAGEGLENDPLVVPTKPETDKIVQLLRYNGTDCYQWYMYINMFGWAAVGEIYKIIEAETEDGSIVASSIKTVETF